MCRSFGSEKNGSMGDIVVRRGKLRLWLCYADSTIIVGHIFLSRCWIQSCN